MRLSTRVYQAVSRRAVLRLLCLLILATSAAAQAAANPAKRQYVGFRHKGVYYGERLRNGAKYLGGGLVSDERYGVTRYTMNSAYMLWLEKILYRDAEGTPTWEVKDVLTFNKLASNHEFLFSYSSPCTIGGQSYLDLIVLARSDNRRKTLTPVLAWTADAARESFQPVPIESIVCN